eukprot:g16594.t2
MLKSMVKRLEQFTKYLPAFRQQEDVSHLSEFVLQEVVREENGEGDGQDDGIGSFSDDSVMLDHIIKLFPRSSWEGARATWRKIGLGGLLSKHKERSPQAIAPSMADILNVRYLHQYDPDEPDVSGARLVDELVSLPRALLVIASSWS